jgi:flavin reductase (DIM6/NTAB) family NADH-FMN oxidoreductase RutF
MNKNIFQLVDHEIFVISTRHEQKINGQIATWIIKASLAPEPLRIMAVISPFNYTYQLIKKSKIFTVQLLTTSQIDLVPLFGLKSGKDINKFEGLKFYDSKSGLPVLEDICGFVECKTVQEIELGDRIILIADVFHSDFFKEKTPLLKSFVLRNSNKEIQNQLQNKMLQDGLRDQKLMKLF